MDLEYYKQLNQIIFNNNEYHLFLYNEYGSELLLSNLNLSKFGLGLLLNIILLATIPFTCNILVLSSTTSVYV